MSDDLLVPFARLARRGIVVGGCIAALGLQPAGIDAIERSHRGQDRLHRGIRLGDQLIQLTLAVVVHSGFGNEAAD